MPQIYKYYKIAKHPFTLTLSLLVLAISDMALAECTKAGSVHELTSLKSVCHSTSM